MSLHQIIDMLYPQHTNLALREDPQMGVFVDGLEERGVGTLREALGVVNSALENRVMASTLMVCLVEDCVEVDKRYLY